MHIKKLRRVVTEGTFGKLWASERPCCEAACSACSGRGHDGHAHRNCATSSLTRCRQIQIQPASDSAPVSRGGLARDGEILGEAALSNDVLAAETNSNTAQFLLIRAVADGVCDVPENYTCPVDEANFTYPRNKKAIRAVLLRPVITGRNEESFTRYEEHSNAPSFLVPSPNLRVGKIKMKEQSASRRVAPPRAAAAAAAAIAPPRPSILELPAGARMQVIERCGVY